MEKPNFIKWGKQLEEQLKRNKLFHGSLERHLESAYEEGYKNGVNSIKKSKELKDGYENITNWLVI